MLGVLILAAGTSSFLFQTLQRPPLIYKGVSLDRWIEITDGTGDMQKSLAEIGPGAIAYLTRALEKQDSLFKKAWLAIWKRLPRQLQMKFFAHRPVSAGTARNNALWGLRLFGPEARIAVPQLVKIFNKETNMWTYALASHALAEAGQDSPEAQAILLEALHDKDRFRRSQAAGALWEAGWKSKSAVPLLMKELKEAEKPIMELLALGEIGPEAEEALPLVIKALKNQELRGNALTALKGIGAADADAVPVLLEIFDSGSKQLSPQAIEVLLNMGPTAQAALPVLTQAQADEDATMRILATVAVAKIRGDLTSAVPVLAKELRNYNTVKDWSYWNFQPGKSHAVADLGLNPRQTAAWFLGEMGPSAKEALPELVDALNARDSWLPVFAARAIWKIDRQTEVVLPRLLNALASKEETQCVLAARFLGEMGPPAKPALPALIQARKVSLAVRREANDAIQKIDPETAEQVRHK